METMSTNFLLFCTPTWRQCKPPIKTLTGSKKSTRESNKLKIDGRDVDNTIEIAEQFNHYFSTVAEKLRSQIPHVAFDLSKLVNFVESRKDSDVKFSVPV